MFQKLLLIVGLFVVWRMASRALRRARPDRDGPAPDRGRTRDEDRRRYGDLTQQDISDADFEELPDDRS